MITKVKTFSQIADEYGIHINTLRRWIIPIKDDLQINGRRLLLDWQIKIIYEYLSKKNK